MEIRTVVIGYGRSLNARLFHCNAIRATQGLTLYGICARNPQYREEAQRAYGVKVYADLDEVLEDDRVDLVVIATPSYLHADMAIRALTAGKHVVVEKPMCLKVSEADAMIEAAQRHGRLLTVRQNRRWDPDFRTVQKVLSEGTLGSVFLLSVTYTDLLKPTGWRTQRALGGGVIYDLGSHLIDQALQLIPSKPTSVYATAGNWGWNTEAETYARVWIRLEDGATVDIELSHISWIPRPRWYILGENGSLIYENGRFRVQTREGEATVELAVGKEEFYDHVARAIRGHAPLAVTPEEVKKSIQIMEAAFLSIESGEVVRLE